MRSSRTVLIIGIVVMTICGCKSDYTKLVHRELGSGVVQDSLIFDMYMGQTRKEFFEVCWELNRQKFIHQGSGANVVYELPPDPAVPDREDVTALFYGAFDSEKVMRGMDFTYSYDAWAPWNKQLYSDSLAVYLRGMLLRQYGGNDWLEVELEETGTSVHVKVDGNRRILMYIPDTQNVKVKIRDLNNPIENEQAQ